MWDEVVVAIIRILSGIYLEVLREAMKNPETERFYSAFDGAYLMVFIFYYSMLGGSLVTTAWRVLRLRMEGTPPGTEGSCGYIE
jgi:hypothetical protein